MKHSSIFLGVFVACSTLAGCSQTISTYQSKAIITARENSQYQALSMGATKITSYQDALAGANQTCQTANKGTPVIVSEETTYQGLIGERVGKAVRDIGTTVGDWTGIKKPKTSYDDDYQTTLKFYCQK